MWAHCRLEISLDGGPEDYPSPHTIYLATLITSFDPSVHKSKRVPSKTDRSSDPLQSHLPFYSSTRSEVCDRLPKVDRYFCTADNWVRWNFAFQCWVSEVHVFLGNSIIHGNDQQAMLIAAIIGMLFWNVHETTGSWRGYMKNKPSLVPSFPGPSRLQFLQYANCKWSKTWWWQRPGNEATGTAFMVLCSSEYSQLYELRNAAGICRL